MLDKKFLEELQEFLEFHLTIVDVEVCKSSDYIENNILEESLFHSEIEDFIKSKQQPSYQEILFSFIDNKGYKDPEVYKRAGIDRKLFSKIRSNSNYRPGKNTILALALALELNKKETDKLLSSAGYSLSDSDQSDLVILFCLEKKIYDINYVNETLDYFSLKPLSGVL
jgi:hypothetical protein